MKRKTTRFPRRCWSEPWTKTEVMKVNGSTAFVLYVRSFWRLLGKKKIPRQIMKTMIIIVQMAMSSLFAFMPTLSCKLCLKILLLSAHPNLRPKQQNCSIWKQRFEPFLCFSVVHAGISCQSESIWWTNHRAPANYRDKHYAGKPLIIINNGIRRKCPLKFKLVKSRRIALIYSNQNLKISLMLLAVVKPRSNNKICQFEEKWDEE